MEKKKIVVVGCSSTGGQQICKELTTSEKFDIVAGFDTMFSTALNYPFKTCVTVDDLKSLFITIEITKEITTKEFTTKEITTEEFTTEEFTTKKSTTKEFTTKKITTKEIATEEITTEEIKTEEITTEEITVEEFSTEEFSTKEFSRVEITTNETTKEGFTTVLLDIIVSSNEMPDDIRAFALKYDIPLVTIKDANEITKALEEYIRCQVTN